MKPRSFTKGIVASISTVTSRLTTTYQAMKIKMPDEDAAPLSMVTTAFILTTIGLVVNVVLRHITLQRLIADPYINLAVLFVGVQIVAFCIFAGIAFSNKAFENMLKRP